MSLSKGAAVVHPPEPVGYEMDKIVIKACLNGMRGREQSPHVPWTPAEIAAEAKRCADAGAAIVHIHARTPEGEISYDPEWYTEADRLIREQTDLIVNHTTARMPDATIDQVLRYLRETSEPVDMISLNSGNIVFNTPLGGRPAHDRYSQFVHRHQTDPHGLQRARHRTRASRSGYRLPVQCSYAGRRRLAAFSALPLSRVLWPIWPRLPNYAWHAPELFLYDRLCQRGVPRRNLDCTWH